MDVATTCPACGAVLSADPDATEITCTFCGNRFELDMSGVAPVLKVANSSREMPEPPATPLDEPPMPTFVTANAVEPAAPPQPTYASTPPAAASRPSFLSGRPLWIIIAVLVALFLCVVFACMALGAFAVNLGR